MTPEDIIAEARSWIGTPYAHQGSLKGVGCDCIGLVAGIWRALIGPLPLTLPPYAPDWAEVAKGEPMAEAARTHLVEKPLGAVEPADVLLFRWQPGVAAKHVAIASRSGFMIHAHDGASVSEVALSPGWRRKLAYRFSFPDLA